MPLRPARMRLTGWGRYRQGVSLVVRPEKLSELKEVLDAGHRPILARGLGRSYGDAALNDGGIVVDLTRLNRILSFDRQSGKLCCEAGVTFADLLESFLPRGFFPPVIPGTKFVTLGGALAADIHGKNHHRDSSFSAHVDSFRLLTACGEIKQCSRSEHSELFWATVGGMGLTGIIIDLEFRLRPIDSAYLREEIRPLDSLENTVKMLDLLERDYEFSVAWIDCASFGPKFGRSVAMFANFATRAEVEKAGIRLPLDVHRTRPLTIPFDFPTGAINDFTVRAFNEAYYNLHRRRTQPRFVHVESFFFPLDRLGNWNRLYGRRGLLQYQCALPNRDGQRAVIEILEQLARSRVASSLAVLKKLGRQEGMLTFPVPGYTLAMDFPARDASLKLFEQLDEIVLRYGGRIYLAKDASMSPESFRRMYPDFNAWLNVKKQVDPLGSFSSQLSRRLGIDAALAS